MPRLVTIAEPLPDLSSVALRQVIGRRIRQLRRAKNLTQFQLARKAQIAPNTLRGIEMGTKRGQYAKLARVAQALQTTIGVLMHAIDGQADAWANPLLRHLLTEDLQIAQQYHHANTPVRAAVRRVLANPSMARRVSKQELPASFALYLNLGPQLQGCVDAFIAHLDQFRTLDSTNNNLTGHSA